MVPVGGVTLENAADFIRAGCAALGVGAGILNGDPKKSSHYEDITGKASQFLGIIQKTRPAHE
jgi:2-dehydro-3-deoxyphosphogluconate aldolase/(4S)-4-hydroxy-2-oxoglutarate aldolase